MARKDIDLYNIDTLPENLRQAVLELRQDFDSHNHDGANSASFRTLTVETLAARVVSIRKSSFSSPVGGVWMGLDGNTAKFYVGDGSSFIKYDGSSLSIKGNLDAGSINIPNTTDPLFSVDSSGNAIMKSYSLLSNYTAGEAITAGRLVCLKHNIATWGDDNGADKDTTALISGITWVDGVNPTTAQNEPALPKFGHAGGGQIGYLLGKIDIASNPPGVPEWNDVDKVILRMYVVSTNTNAFTPTLKRLTAAFTESTVTFNTIPADDGVTWATAKTGTTTIGESMATTANGQNAGYIDFDITELYRLWEAGTLTNHGFILYPNGSAGDGYISMGGRTRTGGGSFNQAPCLIVTPTVNNPGTTTATTNDGKVYHASTDDYNLVKNIVGIAEESVAAAATVGVYSLADQGLIPTSVLSTVTGKNYYLNGTAGQITTLTNDIVVHNEYNISLGVGTSTGLRVNLEKQPVFIKSVSYPGTGILPPAHAKTVIIDWIDSGFANANHRGQIILSKSFHNSQTIRIPEFVGSGADDESTTVTASWASETSGLLTITGTGTTTATIKWYK